MAAARLTTLHGQSPGSKAPDIVVDQVLHELIDALFYENFLGINERATLSRTLPGGAHAGEIPLADEELFWSLPLPQAERMLVLRVRRQHTMQPYRLSRPPALLLEQAPRPTYCQLSPVELIRLLVESIPAAERAQRFPGLAGFVHDLEVAIEQQAVSHEAAGLLTTTVSQGRPGLLEWERLAALRDRPFHPSARAKSGWSAEEYRQFGAEHGRSFALRWLALRNDFVHRSDAARRMSLPEHILTQDERVQLAAALSDARLPSAEYTVLPVHPWQMRHVLPDLYDHELNSGICLPLPGEIGAFRATSSVRSLTPEHSDRHHLKLPLGITSLGALRILPSRYLANGVQAQQLLTHLVRVDATLARLHLCDETAWWTFYDPAGDPFADKPGQLACQLRVYPAELCSNTDIDLMPMAALAVVAPDGRVPAVDFLLHSRGSASRPDQALELFADVCRQLVEVCLRCFGYGIMPEVHGQNVLLILRGGRLAGLLLRDHDTLRIYEPWLQQRGLTPPRYLVKPNSPNTLINDTPEQLLSYFQTLGVQVNLHAIAEALARGYGLAEHACWQVVRQAIAETLRSWDGPAAARRVAAGCLLGSTHWPAKLLLAPLLARHGYAGAGMPSATGSTRNPLVAPGACAEAL